MVMEVAMKGMMPFLVLGIIASALGAGLGLPVAYDHFMGNQTMPDNALHGLETAGENIRCAFSPDKVQCFLALSNERTNEHAYIQNKMRNMAGEERENMQRIADEIIRQAEQHRATAESMGAGT